MQENDDKEKQKHPIEMTTDEPLIRNIAPNGAFIQSMETSPYVISSRRAGAVVIHLSLLLAFLLACTAAAAQSNILAGKPTLPDTAVEGKPAGTAPNEPPKSAEGDGVDSKSAANVRPDDSSSETGSSSTPPSQFRVERMPMAGGAELLTIFGRLDGMRTSGLPAPEVPLVSVVRDTLADDDPENDRLRYVWMLTYTEPTLLKRIASAIPFLYQHVGDKKQSAKGPPSPILDLANTHRQTWNGFLWAGLQNVFLDSYGIPLKVVARSYRRNASDYRTAHVTQALAILTNYETLRQRSRDESELLARRQSSGSAESPLINNDELDEVTPLLPERSPAFTIGEMLELRARLILSGKTLGGLFGPDKFHDTVEKESMNSIDIAGHNWELLRQRAEAEGLYFEPLTMPNGRATHALLWISKSDLTTQTDRSFSRRFLNIADPWGDRRLRNWSGYTQVRYFDRDNRPTNAADPLARSVEMVPLALYGLDHPKIPALLVDFRDTLNPKKREMSRRVLHDVTRNIFSLSSFGNLPYFLGRTAYDWITGRRGMDLNQPTRLTSYSQLKLLLSFNGSIEPKLRSEIERRLENVSLNPLNNDNRTEVALARQQYDSLRDFARRPDGLPARIERDRRAEMVPLEHGPVARFLFNLGNVLTFGRYVHREQATPELAARMEQARRLDGHTQFLRGVAKSSPQAEVVWDLNPVKHSLQFLVDRGAGANGSAARAAAAIFQRTNDAEVRRLCLDALYKINSRTAKNELLRIYRAEQPQSEWRAEIAERLRKAVAEDTRMKPAEVRSVLGQVGQP